MKLYGEKVTFSDGLYMGIKVEGRIGVVLIIREWTNCQGKNVEKMWPDYEKFCEVWVLGSCCFRVSSWICKREGTGVQH